MAPDLVSDGGGLPFTLAALLEPGEPLDPEDPAVRALMVQIKAGRPKVPVRSRLRRSASAPEPEPISVDAWRVLARAEKEVLFGRGRPPHLVTVGVELMSRRLGWVPVSVSRARPIRVARDGIRASSFRLDPTQELGPMTTTLRILVTEQSYAGGMKASGRLLPPDIHLGPEDVTLRIFVALPVGFQTKAPNPETPVRVTLPEPLGDRLPVDGAVLWAPPPQD